MIPGERGGELARLARLAVPLAAQQVGVQLMGNVDAALLGRYSDAALAGAGVANNLLFGITSLGLGMVMGMDTVVPQALGGGRHDDARRAVGAGVRLAVLVGLVLTLATFATPLVLDVAHVDPAVTAEATPYLYLRAIGIVPFLITVALRSYLAAHHTTRPLIIAVVAGNLLNFVLDVALIFGVPALHIPPLGVLGAALATTAVLALTVVVYAISVNKLDGGAPRPRSTTADLLHVARVGAPVGGQLFAEVGIFGVATVIAGHLGELPAAAHSIALGISSFTFSFAVGVASATSVRVGLATGAGDLQVARRRGLVGLALVLGVMACFATAFALVPREIARAFSADPTVLAATVPLLYVAAAFQLFDGTQSVVAGALRGLGRTRDTFVANVVGHYAIGLPVLLALGFAAGLGIIGVWWGLSCGLAATGLYLVVQFLRATRDQK
ncbi:MAG TPA: MATE family efflux transporter [Kofleriaceae bacterium]